MTFGCLFGSFLGTLGSLFLIFEGLGSRSENQSFSRDTLEGPRLRQYGQVVVKGHSVGALSTIQYGWRLQDTGYNLQDTGIEGCKCKDAGSKDTKDVNARMQD